MKIYSFFVNFCKIIHIFSLYFSGGFVRVSFGSRSGFLRENFAKKLFYRTRVQEDPKQGRKKDFLRLIFIFFGAD